jgi:hypothetical protein
MIKAGWIILVGGLFVLAVAAAAEPEWCWYHVALPALDWLHITPYGGMSTPNAGVTTPSCWGIEVRPALAVFHNCG